MARLGSYSLFAFALSKFVIASPYVLPRGIAALPGNVAVGTTAACSLFHTVSSGETCDSVEAEFSITDALFHLLNPEVNTGCTNLITGEAYCVQPASAVSPQAPVASGTVANCSSFHTAVSGETCDSIEEEFGISDALFRSLNQGINSECTNIFAGEAYCVEAASAPASSTATLSPSSTATSPANGTVTSPPSSTSTTPANGTVTSLPSSTPITPANGTVISSPSGTSTTPANGTVTSLPSSISTTPTNGTVTSPPSSTSTTPAKNTTTSSTSSAATPSANSTATPTTSSTSTTPPVTTTSSPSATAPPANIASGTTTDCASFHTAVSGETCDSVEAEFNISDALFHSLNQGINSECTNLIAGEAYCVEAVSINSTASGTPTGSSSTPTATAPPANIASGTTTNCGAFHTAVSGETCDSVEAEFGISDALFHSLNQGINSECTNLIAGEAYCVQAPSASTSPSASPTSTPVSPAAPVASGTTTDCGSFHVVVPGETCDSVEADFGITDALFHSLNPEIDSDCTNLIAGEAYCVDSSAIPSAPANVASGTITGGCTQFFTVQSGQDCDDVEALFGISSSLFIALNPEINSGCTNLFAGNAYCVQGTAPS